MIRVNQSKFTIFYLKNVFILKFLDPIPELTLAVSAFCGTDEMRHWAWTHLELCNAIAGPHRYLPLLYESIAQFLFTTVLFSCQNFVWHATNALIWYPNLRKTQMNFTSTFNVQVSSPKNKATQVSMHIDKMSNHIWVQTHQKKFSLHVLCM